MATITPIAGSDVRYWWIFLLRALLFLIAGFLTVRYPIESYLALSIFFGVTMLLTGIIELVYAISHRKEKGWGWRLFAAIVDLILGVILVMNLGLTMAILPFFVGFWFLFRGSLFRFASRCCLPLPSPSFLTSSHMPNRPGRIRFFSVLGARTGSPFCRMP